MERGSAGDTSENVELELITRKGQNIAVGLKTTPLRDKDKLTGMLWFARDDSARERIHRKLNSAASLDFR